MSFVSSQTKLVSSLVMLALALGACTHEGVQDDAATQRAPSSFEAGNPDMPTARESYTSVIGMAMEVTTPQSISIIPSRFDSAIPGQTFDGDHPLVLQPGDAFTLLAQEGSQIYLRFDYPEIVTGWVDVHAFPAHSLKPMVRSLSLKDEAMTAAGSDADETQVAGIGVAHARAHSGGSNCALTPNRPGCCLAAVKYKLRDMGLVKADLSNFPGVYGKFATQNLPSSWHNMGCSARTRPKTGMVCSYNSSFNPAAGHVEVFDGAGWYFGLGHTSLQNDGHHSCLDCKMPH